MSPREDEGAPEGAPIPISAARPDRGKGTRWLVRVHLSHACTPFSAATWDRVALFATKYEASMFKVQTLEVFARDDDLEVHVESPVEVAR